MTGARRVWLSFGVLVAVAAIGGLWAGLRAIEPTETQIIEAGAADYIAATGGQATDCFARPSATVGIRLVVICMADPDDPETAWARAYDDLGREVEVDLAELEREPVT